MSDLQYRTTLFWDINPKTIEQVLIDSDSWVVLRVFEYGTLDDISDVISLYGEQRVKEILTTEKLQPMTKAMAFLLFNVDVDGRFTSQR